MSDQVYISALFNKLFYICFIFAKNNPYIHILIKQKLSMIREQY